MPSESPRYSWKLLRAGEFRLDAGSMFGLVPRVVWSRTVPIDDRGRMTVQHNCLLLTPEGGGAPLLIETGSGDKMDAKSKDIFAMGDRTVLTALVEADCDPATIAGVFLTHLHFDHAGGLTRLARHGETPDWTGPGSNGEMAVKLSFPNARVYAQAREWSDALANRSVMTRTYFRENLEPVRDRLAPLDSPRAFALGHTPDRDERPAWAAEVRWQEALPGVSVLSVPGHTWGQQAIGFTDTAGRRIVFTPDVMPTVHHVGAAYSLGYDVEPYTSMVTRGWFLAEAARGDWLLVLDHEPGDPCVRVRENGKGWFELRPEA